MMKTLSAGLLILSLCAPVFGQGKGAAALPDTARKWLNEEVVYIITPKEREVFLKLRTDREREIFIEAFWKQRDSTPGTEKNEFREEHYRRLGYANRMYGRGTPVPGSRTDRGRIYILLGEPKSIEQFDTVQNVYPTEIWSYLGDPALGLPTGFNVIFFKEHGTGDYILYSPGQHGPQALIASTSGDVDMRDEREAYKELQKLAPNLAYQTLSLIPGERNTPGMMSLASNTLIANIYALPRKMVKDSYADAILKYKDFVEVEYTANYFESEGQVWVVRDPSGFFEVHYAVEPKKITVEDAGDRFNARFELNGRVTDAAGRTILQFDRGFPFSIEKNAAREGTGLNVSLQGAFPIIAGRYNLDLLLKNVASRGFTSVTAKLDIPAGVPAPILGPIVLGYGALPKPQSGERSPFAVGGTQVLSASQKVFASSETLAVAFQVLGLTAALRADGRVKYTFFKEDAETSALDKPLTDLTAGDLVVLEQPLASLAPGYYKVRVELLDGKGVRLDTKSADFELSTRPSIPRPMVVASVAAAYNREDYLYATGLEYMNAGDLKEAGSRLAEAYALKPSHPSIATAYGLCLLALEDYAKAKVILGPLAPAGQGSAEVVAALGRTLQALGEYAAAADRYREYLERFGANVEILNYLGTCYLKTGNREEALKAWEKSLELSPDQPKIRELVTGLKK